MSIRGRLILITTALFAAFGPLIGLCLIVVSGLASSLSEEPAQWLASVQASLFVFVYGLPIAYLLGVLPAAITGTVVGAVKGTIKVGNTASLALLAIVGVVSGYATCLAAQALWPEGEPLDRLVPQLGAAAGGIGGLIAAWLSRRGPNNSFNPMPLRGTG